MSDSSAATYPSEPVPLEERGSAIPLFFIVTGSLCGLPVLLLAGGVAHALGCGQALAAFVTGSLIAGLLGGLTAFCGSVTGCNTAMLAERTFGAQGSLAVKAVLSLCLIGWYVVIAALLGETVGRMARDLWSTSVSPTLVTAIALLLVGCIVLRGVRGLEWLGYILVPSTAALLIYAIAGTAGSWPGVVAENAPFTFGSAMGAVLGIYIVGIVIQPDFGRFVLKPRSAALASGSALALAYPAILSLAGLAAIGLKAPSVVDGLVPTAAGNIVFAIVVGGALIDSSLSLYSGSVGLANLMRLRTNRSIIAIASLAALVLSLTPTDALFIQYLNFLSVALPPLAVAIICHSFLSQKNLCRSDFRKDGIFAWAVGAFVGLMTTYGSWDLTTIPSLDSILIAFVASYVAIRSPLHKIFRQRVIHGE